MKLKVHNAEESLVLVVKDEDVTSSDVVGTVTIPLRNLCAGGAYEATILHKGKSAGIVNLRPVWKAGPIERVYQQVTGSGILTVTVVRAEMYKDADTFSKMDPFVTL